LRFYFHVGGGKFVQDRDGIELADVQAAKNEAVHYAFSLANLEEGFLGRLKGGAVIVVNEEGAEVTRVPLPMPRGNKSQE
jgi:uncharacterized protein DUF6894